MGPRHGDRVDRAAPERVFHATRASAAPRRCMAQATRFNHVWKPVELVCPFCFVDNLAQAELQKHIAEHLQVPDTYQIRGRNQDTQTRE